MEEEQANRALPRWHHWLAAAAILAVMMQAVPLFAAFL